MFSFSLPSPPSLSLLPPSVCVWEREKNKFLYTITLGYQITTLKESLIWFFLWRTLQKQQSQLLCNILIYNLWTLAVIQQWRNRTCINSEVNLFVHPRLQVFHGADEEFQSWLKNFINTRTQFVGKWVFSIPNPNIYTVQKTDAPH